MTREGNGKVLRATLVALALCLGIGWGLVADAPPTPTRPTGLETAVDGGAGPAFIHPGDSAVTQRVTLTDSDAGDEDDVTLREVVVDNLGTALSPDFALIEILDGVGNVIGQAATPAALPVTIDIDPDFVIPDEATRVIEVRSTVAPGAAGRRTIQTTIDVVHTEGVIGPFHRVVADTTPTTINNCPNAVDDNAATNEASAVVVAVQANDVEADGDPLTTTLVGAPAKGTAVVGPGQAITYDPNGELEYLSAGEVEDVTFDYRITDGDGTCGVAQATVTVAVTGVNDAPIANGDVAVTDEDTPININVLVNDADVDHLDVLQVQGVNTAGTVGCVSINPNNTIRFDPCGQFVGLKASQFTTFEYTVSDGQGGTDTATVTVEVTGINNLPVANDDTANTDEDNAVVINVLGNDTDLDSALTVCSITAPAHGAVVSVGANLRYTPNPNWFGIDTFTYRACDELNGDWATVTVTVASVNDQPTANDDSVVTNEDTAIDIAVLVNDTDVDLDVLQVTLLNTGAPYNTVGCVSINPGSTTIRFDPCGQYEGLKASQFTTFQYTVSDGHGGTDTAVVTVEVTGINDLPVANDDAANTDEDNAVVINVLGNDTDVDSALTVCQFTQGAHGTVAAAGASLRYTPNANWCGIDTFTYRACDELNGDWATVTVTVTCVNDAPVANAGPDQIVDEGTNPVTLTGAASSDVEGSPLTYHWTQIAGPVVALSNPSAVSPTFAAPRIPVDTNLVFQLIVSDGDLNSAPDQVTVSVLNTCTVAPPAPSNVVATVASAAQVDLTWLDGAILTEDGFHIYRALGSGAPAYIGDAPIDATTYSDTTVSCGQLYRYFVSAFNSCGESTRVNALAVATPSCGGGCPVADAGLDQTTFFGDPAYLNGSGSTGATEYWWEFLGVPAGAPVPAFAPSNAVVGPQFVPTQLGDYTARLWVKQGTCWRNDDVTVTVTVAPNYLAFWNLENGTKGWTKSGSWNLVTGGGCCSTMPSPTHAWGYTHPGSKRATGWVVSPWINLPAGQNAVSLWFWQSLSIGAAGGITTQVDVSFGRSWVTIWTNAGDTGGIWRAEGPIQVNVPTTAKKMRVRFLLTAFKRDSAPACWCIDNVAIGPWVGPLASLGTMDADADAMADADVFEVYSVSNTPNPVTDVHTTRFEVKGVGIEEIMVQIFDLSGQVVFDSGWQPNGYDWHVQSDAGETLANGVYLYVVTVRGVDGSAVVTKTQKLVVYR